MPCILIQFICFAVLLAIVKSENNDFGDDAIERGDAYLDKLLKDMFEDRVEEYDPYRIDDSAVGFHKKIAFVNISGEAKLHDGYITGLKTLHRSNHCSLKEKNGRLNVKADLGAGVLDFHYSGSVKFMNFGPTISVEGNLGYLEVLIEFSVDSDTGRNGKLTMFQIDDMRGLKVWITGLGPLNWAVNPIIAGVTKIFKRIVKNFMEKKVRNHIAEYVPNFQFPVEPDLQTDVTEIASTATDEPASSQEPTGLETTNEPISETSEVTEEIVETTEPQDDITSLSEEEELVTTEEPKEETDESATKEEIVTSETDEQDLGNYANEVDE